MHGIITAMKRYELPFMWAYGHNWLSCSPFVLVFTLYQVNHPFFSLQKLFKIEMRLCRIGHLFKCMSNTNCNIIWLKVIVDGILYFICKAHFWIIITTFCVSVFLTKSYFLCVDCIGICIMWDILGYLPWRFPRDSFFRNALQIKESHLERDNSCFFLDDCFCFIFFSYRILSTVRNYQADSIPRK